ncbi:MAG: hypothetical protein ABIA59_01240 [Candidatus Latescibacterota bacterium]
MPSPLRQYTTHHDTFGIWHVPNIKLLYPGNHSKSWYIRTNSLGMRDDREFAHAKPEGARRVLLFGDSFAFGSGVEVGERYSNLLEQTHSNIEIMNFGVGSTGVDRQYLIYQYLGKNFDSDILMICPYLNNVARCTGTHSIYQDRGGRLIRKPKPHYTIEDGRLVLKNVPVPREPADRDNGNIGEATVDAEQHMIGQNQFSLKATFIRKFFLYSNYKYWLIKLLPIQPYPEYNSASNPTWLLGKRILREFSKKYGKTTIIAPIPSWSIIMNPKLATYRQRFAELHDPQNGVHVIDILPYFLTLSFRDRKECFLSKYDYHYSAAGHRVTAEALSSELTKINLL